MSREWAWEFLRRNPAFQRDVTAASQQTNTLSYRRPVTLGVLFRGVLWAKFGGLRSGAWSATAG
ncbi:hypothetical protein MES5069_220220 [Mesorhizobium escarrei]|uniref:Transcriptional regulator-like domain-containing protein n=1 Tax=Mesorhizobium escarrei TaxID=666018 RepID=A0ABN8JPF6_9HYPH|nr:hypothetical protein MES5069_220220 [Mesorhizobium escarrei]